MIEKFREKRFSGILKIKYEDGSGNISYWTKDQAELSIQIKKVVNEYMSQGDNLTNRQLYYQLVTLNIIPNADEIYKRICTFITDMKYSGMLDWDAIEDRGRVPQKHIEFTCIQNRIESAIYNYRLPRWDNQNNYVELYVEKEALKGVFESVSDKFHIYLGCNKGYSSSSTMYEIAQRFKDKIKEGKKCYLCYFGDHDSSGLDMTRDIKERIVEFISKGEEYCDPSMFEVVPLALNMGQIKKYNPPPNPAKITDPRAKWYIQKYGNKSWELDSLKPSVLREIAERGILNYVDVDNYNSVIEKEEEHKQIMKKWSENFKEEKKIEQPLLFSKDCLKTRVFLLKEIYGNVYTIETKEDADFFVKKIGSKQLRCPFCDDYSSWIEPQNDKDNDCLEEQYANAEIIQHIFDEHTIKQFNDLVNE